MVQNKLIALYIVMKFPCDGHIKYAHRELPIWSDRGRDIIHQIIVNSRKQI